jgi:hypothetical protein
MKKFLVCFSVFFFLTLIAYAQRDWGGMGALEDDEEIMTLERLGFSLISCAFVAGIGYLLMQIKAIKLLGQVLVFLGAIGAIGGVLGFLLQIIGLILSVVVSFAFKAALVIGGIYLVFRILVGIYEWFTK